MENNYQKTVNRVGLVTILWNLLLSIFKFIAGVLGGSKSMISDALHSASDVFTTIIVMIGAKIGGKAADKDHPYGHERFESIASAFLAILLGGTALGIGYAGIKEIIDFANGKEITATSLSVLALVAAIISIVVKGIMYFYTKAAAKRINSQSLYADAWHHLTDSLSSIGSLVAIVGLMIGGVWVILDPIASIIICILILKVAFDILRSSIDQLIDKSAPNVTINKIVDIVNSNENVKGIENIKTRQFGNKLYVDIDIFLDENLNLVAAHEIAKEVHDSVEQNIPNVKHCMVHYSPDDPKIPEEDSDNSDSDSTENLE